MKRLIPVAVVLLLVIVLIMAGCTQQAAPAPAPAPAPRPAPSQEPTIITPKTTAPTPSAPASAPQKVWELKYADWGPSVTELGQRAIQWADVINERTGGRVKITLYFGQALMKSADHLRGVSAGIADAALYVIGGDQQVNRIMEQPFLFSPTTDTFERTEIFNQLRSKFPELDKELENTRPLYWRSIVPEHVNTVKKPVLVPEDLAGMKLSASTWWEEPFKSVGAALIFLRAPDWYMGLERGLIEGQIIHWNAMNAFRTLELFKYHTTFGVGGIDTPFIGNIINKDTWNSFPPDIQQIFTETGKEQAQWGLEDDQTIQARIIAGVKEQKSMIHQATPAEYQLWVDFTKVVRDKWIKDTAAAGYPAQAIYDAAKELDQKYK
ncbi:MAG: TRAP transporter substrate-binding protein DctP [Chloroflexota bacterium]